MTRPEFPLSAQSLILPFEGCHNFRAVSGWRSNDGRRLIAGRLFRSDQLDRLTDSDQDRLQALNIGQVFDLRARAEIERSPSRWPEGALPMIWSGAESAADADLGKVMTQSGQTADDFSAAMVRTYAKFPDELAGAVRAAAEFLLGSDEAPVLIHCAAGKDRTGFVMAFLLHAIGVRDDDILADYLLTNASYEKAHAVFNAQGRLDAVEDRVPGSVERLLGAYPQYLTAAQASVVDQYGTIAGWLEQCIGLNAKARSNLGDMLLA